MRNSLEKSDNEIKRQAIDLLRDLFEESNYSVTYESSDKIEFEAKYGFQVDSTKNICRNMEFIWNYEEVNDYPYRKGWNICAHISSYESDRRTYRESRSFMIYWSVALKKCQRISPLLE